MPAPLAAAGGAKLLGPILGRAGIGKMMGGKGMGAMGAGRALSGMGNAVSETAQSMGFAGGAQQEQGGYADHPAK
jgi:hypothetical protein